MTLTRSIATAIKGLKSHRSRSLLTTLGIVIGITAIILVMAIGQGAEDLILKQIQGLGSKTIVVIPGRQPSGPSDFAQVFSDSLKAKDLAALKKKENAPTLGAIMPIVFGGESASYGSETYRPTIMGASERIPEIFDLSPAEGRFFDEDEVKGQVSVIVLGSKAKTELFGPNEALGQKIKIKGRSFKVIGVMPEKGQVSFFNFDETALVPYTTAQQYIFGKKYFDRFITEADSEENIGRTVHDITLTLRDSHGITDKTKDDFFIQTQTDLASRIGNITGILKLLLVSLAAISLVVGGIGIMNIMLVSVTERTREIGLRKALGATGKNIMTQFLLEAIMLTALGGIVGIIIGVLLSLLASLVLSRVVGLGWAFHFPVVPALIGFFVSAAAGLIFGLYPARQASKKSPIEALRYE